MAWKDLLNDKHFSLLQTFVIHRSKTFYNIGPMGDGIQKSSNDNLNIILKLSAP
jgi:hypothetical protein